LESIVIITLTKILPRNSDISANANQACLFCFFRM
ncbi:unnamed protein product, partial [marine sediment metagenome]